MWRVVNDTYFRVWFAQVDYLVFERLVQLFNKGVDWNLQGHFYFLGGKTLGLCLLLNLAAAHAIRFKIAAQGKRLYAGIAAIVAGLVVTYLVISAGMDQSVESELSPEFCDILWQCFRGALAVLTVAGAYALTFWNAPAKTKLIEWRVLLVVDVLLAILTVWLLANPDARVDNSGIRILWQLSKATAAAIILLVGCVLVFRKRAGIVLLHGGIALIMLTELFTAVAAVESQMVIGEGETASYSSDIRTSELAIIDHSPADHDQVTVVPKGILVENVGESVPIDDDALPFTIRVHRWLQNSSLRNPTADDKNPATAGFGTQQIAEEAAAATGVGKDAEKIDTSAAYVELTSKKTGKSLGTFLVSQAFKDQPVEVDGKKYDLALRYQRIYHPFSVTLKDFRYDRYAGTNTAKNFSSLVVFKDPQHNIDREVNIFMNNPLRYAGNTFYQSSYDKDTEQATVLQLVRNPSWMTPYVGCMLVMVGMFAHFGIMLYRYLSRRAEDVDRLYTSPQDVSDSHLSRGQRKRVQSREGTSPSNAAFPQFAKWFPAIVLLLCIGYIGSKARMPHAEPGEMQIEEFAKLPVVYEGRVKPYDTLARNTLQILSGRQQVGVINEKGDVTSHFPAIVWLLDAITQAKGSADHNVFRVDNIDLVETLGMKHRPGFWQYSLNDITAKKATDPNNPRIATELDRQISLAASTPEKERSLFQNKVLELARSTKSTKCSSFHSAPHRRPPTPRGLSLSCRSSCAPSPRCRCRRSIPPASGPRTCRRMSNTDSENS